MADQKKKQQEIILQEFNRLRQEQRMMASKISDLKVEESEHKLVVDALNDVKDVGRKCYQLVGGVLTERTVEQVRPNLINNNEKIKHLIKTMEGSVDKKGKELLDFKEKHGIKVRGEDTIPEQKDSDKKDSKAPTSGVLVS